MRTQRDASAKRLDKVCVELTPGAWHGVATETLWAEEVGPSLYRLRNVPLYALGLSAMDIIAIVPKAGLLQFDRVVLRGGHSTYRIFLSSNEMSDPSSVSSRFERAWQVLAELGCTYERGTERLFGVDVPPGANIDAAFAALQRGERDGVWDFQEGHCGHTPVASPENHSE